MEELEEKVENPSFIQSTRALAADFGLNFGWIGIYFILCLPLFSGRTIGKKLLGLKVVRLNNEPIGLWYSFERFGGYAAGLATGLLGFFQVYWDPNRQGIHDKIASTVVVDLREKKRKKTEGLRSRVLETEE
ncbi:RDD family protein [Gracilimonas mengyeensis]|uniref:RDD family protein n=1 Tax=Gracilimonas mengyeensis TaxID=1302730 RepID=UPI003CCC4B3B